MSKRWRWKVGWIAGAAVIAAVFYQLDRNPRWRNFQWGRLGALLIHLDWRLLVLAVLLSGTTYVIRAYRWQCFVNPLKRCSFRGIFAGQVLGFSAIYLIGRPGEIARPAYIARRENLSFTSQLAVWLLERVYDSLALALLCALALYYEPLAFTSVRAAEDLHRARIAGLVILIACGAAMSLLAAFRFWSARFLDWLNCRLTFLPAKPRVWLMRWLSSFSSGLQVIHNAGELAASILSTVLLWGVIVTVMWLDLKCLGGGLARISWLSAGLIQFLAALGLIIQLPGAGGGFQVAVLLGLKDLYHATPEAAAGAAILTYLTVMVPCIVMGFVIAVQEGVSLKKIRAMAESARAAGSQPLSADHEGEAWALSSKRGE